MAVPNPKFGALRLLSFIVLVVMPVFSHAFGAPKREVLVGLWKTSNRDFAKVCESVGKIMGVDEQSKMLIVELRQRVSERSAEEWLIKSPVVRFVLPGAARRPDRTSYASVKNYIAYLEDCAAMNGRDKEAEKGNSSRGGADETASYWNALLYYLRGRVNRAGYFDQNALSRAYSHRSTMPVGHIGQNPFRPAIAASNWSFVGPQNLSSAGAPASYGTISGRIAALTYDPTNASIMYAGSGGGGLFKSTDAGQTWACLSDNSAWKYEAVDAISVDPKNPEVLYVGTGDFDGFYVGYNQGVMKSTDGGATWTNLTPNTAGISDVAVSRIVVDPDNDQIVTITTGRGSFGGPSQGSGGIWRSTDAGGSWSRAPGTATADYSALDVSISNGTSRTYWALGAGDPGLMYKSTDQGATWTQVAAPNSDPQTAWTLACSKISSNTLYVLAPDAMADRSGGAGNLYRSTDGGNSWTDITSGLPDSDVYNINHYNWSQATYDYVLGTMAAPQSPSGEVLFCGLITIAYSLDSGNTWVDYGQSMEGGIVHSDQHQIAFSPSDQTQLLEGNDGGVTQLVFSWSGGKPTVTQNQPNSSLGITQFYHIAPHPSNPLMILGGAQDQGSPCELGIPNSWVSLLGADGGWCDWNVAHNQYILSTEFGDVAVEDFGTGQTLTSSDWSNTHGGFIEPVLTSAKGDYYFVAGQKFIYGAWNQPSYAWNAGATLATGSDYVSYLSIVPTDDDRVYAGDTAGKVSMTTDMGQTFQSIASTALPVEPVGAVQGNPANENQVIVGFQSLGDGIAHVWMCLDVTASPPVWSDVSGSGSGALPDVPVNAVVFDPYQPSTVWYVGTDVGVFMTTNAGASWANVSTGLPAVQVFDLRAGNNNLYAGTFGRGIYRIALAPPADLTGLSVAPRPLVGSVTGVGTVDFDHKSFGSPIVVSLSSSDPSVASVPSSITVPVSSSSVGFQVLTTQVTANIPITLTATAYGETQTCSLTVTPTSDPSLLNFYFGSSTVTGGSTVRGVVQIAKGAPSSGDPIPISSNSALLSAPKTVTIPSGTSGVSFPVSTLPVSVPTLVTLSAISGPSSKLASITLDPAPILNFYTSATSVVAGSSLRGIVQLGGKAGAEGDVVSLNSSLSSVSVPASITIAANSSGLSFAITTSTVNASTSATLTATLGSSSKQTSVIVEPGLKSFYVSPSSVNGGIATTGVVQLTGALGSSDAVISLSSSSSIVTVPSSVAVPPNSSGVSFQVTTSGVSRTESATLTAVEGSLSAHTTLTLNPAPMSKFWASPATFSGVTTGNVELAGLGAPNGTIVSLSSGNSEVTVPSSVTIRAGSGQASFSIGAVPVSANQNVTLTATLGSSSKQTTVTITPPTISNFYVSPASVKGGSKANGVIQLVSEANAGGLVVNLKSSDPHVIVPASVTVTAWTTGVSFLISTSAVTAATSVTLTASEGSSSRTATLTLTP